MPRTNIDIYARLHGSDAKIKTLEGKMGKLDRRAKSTGTSLKGLWKQVAVGMGLTMGVPALARGVTKLAGSFLSVADQVEQYEIRLKTLLGSQEKAAEAMDFFQDIASTLPFTLDEIIESGIRLTTIKVPFKDWLPRIADVASAFGLDMATATDQFARAMSAGLGAADWFREKGISAMIRDFAKLKFGIDDLSKAGTAKLKEVMYEWTAEFSGASEDMAQTWSGMISMIQDAWFNFRRAIMEAGIFELMKEGLQDILDWIEKFKAAGGFEAVALHISTMNEAAKTSGNILTKVIKELDWWVFSWMDAGKKSGEVSREFVSNAEAMAEAMKLRKSLIEDEIITVEEWTEMFNKHGRNFVRVMRAISTLPEYENLRNQWKEIKEEIGGASEEVIEFATSFEDVWERLKAVEYKMAIKKLGEYIDSVKMADEEFIDFGDNVETTALELAGNMDWLATSWGVTTEQIAEATEFWRKESLKGFTDMEAGIMNVLMSYEQGLKGILTSLKRWAIGEAIKGIMAKPWPFLVKLGLAAGAIVAIEGLYSQIAGLKEGAVFDKPTYVSAMMGEGGETEILAPESTLKTIFREVIVEKAASAPKSGLTVTVNQYNYFKNLDQYSIRQAGSKLKAEVDRQFARGNR